MVYRSVILGVLLILALICVAAAASVDFTVWTFEGEVSTPSTGSGTATGGANLGT